MRRDIVLYRKIAEEIKKRILSGVYPVGTYIPSEISLESSFKVSKITVRQAVSLLVGEGYLEKRRGKGTIVISNRPFNRPSKTKSFSAIIEEAGFTITKKILEVSAVPSKNPPDGKHRFDQNMTHVKRIYYLDDTPYILYRHYLRGITSACERHLNLDNISLYRLLKQNNQTIVSFDDTFTTVELSSEEQEILKTSSASCLKRTRKYFDHRELLVELSIGLYNTEIFPYEINYEV